VQSAYFDLAVSNSSLLTVTPQAGAVGDVVFSPLYPNNRSGVDLIETAAKNIDEVGATTTSNYFDATVQLFQMRFRADAAGTLTFSTNPGELVGSIFSLHGFGPVASADVVFGSLALPIASTIALTNNTTSVNEDTGIALDVLANDTGGSSRWTIEAIGDISAGGAVVINNGGKSLTYTPAANFSGTETFKYFTVDSNGVHGQATVTATVTAVDDAPVNVVPGVQTFTTTNRVVTFGPLNSVSTSDVDVGSGKLRVTVFVNNGILKLSTTTGLTFRGGANNSKYILFDGTPTNVNNALLNLKYTANSGTTSDVLTIDTHDLGNTGLGGPKTDRDTVNLALAGTTANKAPVNSVPSAQSYTPQVRQVIFGASNRISVSDADAGAANLRMTLRVNSGVLMLSTTAGLTIVSGANISNNMTFEGTQTSINTALLNLRYTANVGVTSDLLSITTNDLGNTGSGGAKTDFDTVLLFESGVTVNQPPVNTVPGAQTFGSTTRTVTFGSANQVSVSDPDVAGTTLKLRVTLFVNSGIISLGSTANLSFINGGNNTRYLLFDATQADVNTALLNMQYTAGVGVTSDVFTIDTHDLGNSGTGGALVDRDTIALNLFGTTGFGRGTGGGSGEPNSSTATIASPTAKDATSEAAVESIDSAFADPTTHSALLLLTVKTSTVDLADLLSAVNLGSATTVNAIDALFAEDA
jgi:Bacterial Ig domain